MKRAAFILAILSGACADASETALEADPLIIEGDYRGVAFRLSLMKIIEDGDHAVLECVFDFEEPVGFAAGGTPPYMKWSSVDGSLYVGHLVSAPGFTRPSEDDHKAHFRVEIAPAATGGHLSFGMHTLAFEQLERGSRILQIELGDKVVPTRNLNGH